MTIQPATGRWFISFSLIWLFVLAMIPIPDNLALFRPGFIALGVIYWCIALPYRFGIFQALLCGLFIDVQLNYPLGCHGLAMSILAYTCLLINHQFRMFALWQQAGVVFLLLLPYHLILLWLLQLTKGVDIGWDYFIPAVTSAAIWPLIFMILRDGRRRFKVT
jgi:rod shape-determining protein MreD|tara:strand:+ start:85 stop:573 length:489 start_codon:yes stop_codon:yes gene_type:complete